MGAIMPIPLVDDGKTIPTAWPKFDETEYTAAAVQEAKNAGHLLNASGYMTGPVSFTNSQTSGVLNLATEEKIGVHAGDFLERALAHNNNSGTLNFMSQSVTATKGAINNLNDSATSQLTTLRSQQHAAEVRAQTEPSQSARAAAANEAKSLKSQADKLVTDTQQQAGHQNSTLNDQLKGYRENLKTGKQTPGAKPSSPQSGPNKNTPGGQPTKTNGGDDGKSQFGKGGGQQPGGQQPGGQQPGGGKSAQQQGGGRHQDSASDKHDDKHKHEDKHSNHDKGHQNAAHGGAKGFRPGLSHTGVNHHANTTPPVSPFAPQELAESGAATHLSADHATYNTGGGVATQSSSAGGSSSTGVGGMGGVGGFGGIRTGGGSGGGSTRAAVTRDMTLGERDAHHQTLETSSVVKESDWGVKYPSYMKDMLKLARWVHFQQQKRALLNPVAYCNVDGLTVYATCLGVSTLPFNIPPDLVALEDLLDTATYRTLLGGADPVAKLQAVSDGGVIVTDLLGLTESEGNAGLDVMGVLREIPDQDFVLPTMVMPESVQSLLPGLKSYANGRVVDLLDIPDKAGEPFEKYRGWFADFLVKGFTNPKLGVSGNIVGNAKSFLTHVGN